MAPVSKIATKLQLCGDEIKTTLSLQGMSEVPAKISKMANLFTFLQ
jgi:hypothetical protein